MTSTDQSLMNAHREGSEKSRFFLHAIILPRASDMNGRIPVALFFSRARTQGPAGQGSTTTQLIARIALYFMVDDATSALLFGQIMQLLIVGT